MKLKVNCPDCGPVFIDVVVVGGFMQPDGGCPSCGSKVTPHTEQADRPAPTEPDNAADHSTAPRPPAEGAIVPEGRPGRPSPIPHHREPGGRVVELSPKGSRSEAPLIYNEGDGI